MPTPFKQGWSPKPENQNPESEWAARTAKPPRSIFGNYSPAEPPAPTTTTSVTHRSADTPDEFSLQSAIDAAMARAAIYRFLAEAYEDPTEPGWARLVAVDVPQLLAPAARTLGGSLPTLAETVAALQSQLRPESFDEFLTAYLAAFGHAARGRCPLNEIEYGDLKADPLFQPHRLADLAAFYHAFGLEVAADADERQDHICLELESMCVLAAKEAFALEHQLDSEELSICRDAQKRFLREHLARWAPAFARRLARMAGETPLEALANLTRCFVETECARFGVSPGSEDLLLRPVDEAAESMCDACGVAQHLPGAPGPAAVPSS